MDGRSDVIEVRQGTLVVEGRSRTRKEEGRQATNIKS